MRCVCGSFALLLGVLLVPASLPGQGAASPGTFVIEATLKEMSPVPMLKELGTYRESLLSCLWTVTKVTRGTLTEQQIVVYHWSYLDRQPQEVIKWKVGDQRTLTLRPLAEVGKLGRIRKDEAVAVAHLDLPVFYDTAHGMDLPSVVAAAAPPSQQVAEALQAIAGRKDAVRLFSIGDCRVNDIRLDELYAGQAKGQLLNFGHAGSNLPFQEARIRVAAASCPKLEWCIWAGGLRQLFEIAADDMLGFPGVNWPSLPGRSPPLDNSDVTLGIAPGVSPAGGMSIEAWSQLENCIREYHRRGLKFMVVIPCTHNFSARRLDAAVAHSDFPPMVERFRSLAKVYPNFCYVDEIDLIKGNEKRIGPACEQWRLKHEANKQSPLPIAWKNHPQDQRPAPADLAKAVALAKSEVGDLVVGGSWIAQAMRGKGVVAAFPYCGTAEAEFVIRSAVAAGKAPRRIIYGVDPLMLTAPQTECRIGALPGPAWPKFDGKLLTPETVGPIRLSYGTTVARGQGVWEFSLESYLLFEVVLREAKRHKIPVQIVLAPNDSQIPPVSYEGITDRLRALTVLYPNCSFVDPKDLAGKSGTAAGDAIAVYLTNPKKGIAVSTVKPLMD